MIEVGTECFGTRKKGQIIHHVKMQKGGWRYQRRFPRGVYMGFKTRHSPLRLIIAWTMFITQCLLPLCLWVFQKICARLYCTISLGKKSYPEIAFFFYQCQIYEKNSNLFGTPYTYPCGPPLSLGRAAVCLLCSNSHGALGGRASTSFQFSTRNDQVCFN